MSKRLQSIDLLRGIAVILVMFCHSQLDFIGSKMGWSGVDLFFVLSGFLVSGLLFTEYTKEQKIHAGRFLIRRGFKIYPLFWFMLLVYFIIDLITINYLKEYTHSFSWCASCYLHELLFVQNYLPGRVLITWSLAIEEHFYLLLSFFIWIMVKKGVLTNKRLFTGICISVMALCLTLRLTSYELLLGSPYPMTYLTHLRIDSLLFGTLLSYFYHFSTQGFTHIIRRYKFIWMLVMLTCFATATWWQYTGNGEYIFTFGLTLLYVGYGLLMVLVLTTPNIDARLKKVLTRPLLALLATIGYYSYSIYLFHIMVANMLMPGLRKFITFPFYFVEFSVYFILSILTGIYVSRAVEIPFLKIRERMFPRKDQKAI